MRCVTCLATLLLLTTATAPRSPAASSSAGDVGIEYVAHACFIVTSPSGTRVAIDPFNSHIWLGYSFPDPPPVDAILITHPHYDHDASYHWPREVPVFRRPGRYAVGEVRLEGLAGRHAEPYGEGFGRTNTVWVVEVAGLRIAHLGDNGPLDDSLVEALGRIDVLMLGVDSSFHNLKEAEVEDVLDRLQPRLTVPMHYLIPALSDAVEGLGPLDPWLEGRRHVTRLASHSTSLRAAELPAHPSILVFEPSPAVKTWGEAFLKAEELAGEARAAARADDREGALAPMREALELVPGSIRYSAMLAGQLAAADEREAAITVLERALAGAGREDWRTTANARVRLAKLYQATGRDSLAARQYRLVLASSHQLQARRQAEDFFAADEAPGGAAGELAGIAGLDVFGSDQINAAQVKSAVGEELSRLEALRSDGEHDQASRLRDEIEAEIDRMGDFADVRISRIRYFHEGQPIYITIDLVDAADAATRMAFNPEPTAEPAEDPQDLLAAWQEYEQTAMGLLSRGEIDGRNVECPAFHCIVGFAHPDLERFAALFESAAPEHKSSLKTVLASSSDVAQRASAAYLLAHIDDARELLAALLPAIADPSFVVRNNVLRVLQQVAREQRELDIPLDPILRALDFPATSDRNKSLAVLDGLAERPELRPEIARRAGAMLVEILELLQPNNHDYAYSILKKISGEDFGERDYAAWRAWLER